MIILEDYVYQNNHQNAAKRPRGKIIGFFDNQVFIISKQNFQNWNWFLIWATSMKNNMEYFFQNFRIVYMSFYKPSDPPSSHIQSLRRPLSRHNTFLLLISNDSLWAFVSVSLKHQVDQELWHNARKWVQPRPIC